MYKRYAAGITSIIFAGSSAKEAIAMCEKSPEEELRSMLAEMGEDAGDGDVADISKIQANLYNTVALSKNIDCMLHDLNVSAAAVTKCCLLGVLLQKYGTISYQESRVILNSYNQYLKGEINNE